MPPPPPAKPNIHTIMHIYILIHINNKIQKKKKAYHFCLIKLVYTLKFLECVVAMSCVTFTTSMIFPVNPLDDVLFKWYQKLEKILTKTG